MTFEVEDELKSICEDICSQQLSVAEWSLLESDDAFQSSRYCGGFDATERAFCFSLFDKNGDEFWFQFTLDEAKDIVSGNLTMIEARKAEKF